MVKNSPIQHQQIKQNNHQQIHNTNVIKQYKQNVRFNPIEPRNFFSKSSVTGKCYIISNDRFALETSIFVPAIIETFKTIPSRLYGNYNLINLKIICYFNDILLILIYIYLMFSRFNI